MIIRKIVQASPAVIARSYTCQTWRAFSKSVLNRTTPSKAMGTSTTTSIPHEERTAAEPREHGLHKVILDRIEEVNTNIRLLKLKMHNGDEQLQACNFGNLQFLPGQWLDVFVPGVRRAGGFTITSTPRDLIRDKYLELAVQNSPGNPPAAWLWQQASKILHSELIIRVGGSFFWPPPGIDLATIGRVVFIAGGVGINPLISILSHLRQNERECPPCLEFLYSVRKDFSSKASSILFLDRLRSIFRPGFGPNHNFKLFITQGAKPPSHDSEERIAAIDQIQADTDHIDEENTKFRRFGKQDLIDAIGPVVGRKGVVAYVCGPPPLTDWAVEVLRGAEGMEKERVLCEKWW